jgi:outer membrane protein OmpA-like peptidoglycan-associated protein
MKPKRLVSLLGMTSYLALLSLYLGGCGTAPKPVYPDGSARTPANDPQRIQAFQERVTQDRALLSENNLLKAQVDALRDKLNEMTTIVRDALLLPPAQPQPLKPSAPAASPAPGGVTLPAPSAPAAGVLQPAPANTNTLPAQSVEPTKAGVVLRVFHPFARTDFMPSDELAQLLRAQMRQAESIEVRGMTDSFVINPVDRMIALERAVKARSWLVAQGAAPGKIRTRYFSAGNFLAENRTAEGRALNRRVEVELRSQQLASAQ